MCLQAASINKWQYWVYPESAGSECARIIPGQVHSYIPTWSGLFKVNLTNLGWQQGPNFLFLIPWVLSGKALREALYSVLPTTGSVGSRTKSQTINLPKFLVFIPKGSFLAVNALAVPQGRGLWVPPWSHPCSQPGFSPRTANLTHIFLTHLTVHHSPTQGQEKTYTFTPHWEFIAKLGIKPSAGCTFLPFHLGAGRQEYFCQLSVPRI